MSYQSWVPPESGDYYVAVPREAYERRMAEVDNFFGRPLSKLSYNVILIEPRESFAVFSLARAEEAKVFSEAFGGQPFDPRDKGRGSKWMFWYRGRTAKRERNRSPYDFKAP